MYKRQIIDNWKRSYTYCELLTKVNQFSSHLQSMGVNKGTNVGLLLYNCAEFAVAFLALSRLRAVTVPMPGKYQKPEVLSLIERGDVTALSLIHISSLAHVSKLYPTCRMLRRLPMESTRSLF